MDDEGNMPTEADVNSKGQVYPDGVPIHPPDTPRPIFGMASFTDLLEQDNPRMFSSHLPARLLPDMSTHGQFIVVLRNPKDAATSMHFFNGEAKDGWLGNEHGIGSFNRFLADPTPNAYGNMWDHILETEKLVDQLGDRALVLYYEEMKADTFGQIARIASHMGRSPTEKLVNAVANATSMKTMAKEREGKPAAALIRKGEVGDWQNHLDPETWDRVDAVFDAKLAGCKLYEPMKRWMRPKAGSF
eukprot:m.47734 g.47734  ORF g.47734 m.47734 type:complete len:245 (-) comp6923_c0_seq1:2033-2767(-)